MPGQRRRAPRRRAAPGRRDITLEANAFDAYLAEEGLIGVIAARVGRGDPGRERYSRCLKALIARGRPGGEVAGLVIGQTLEIVPERDPLALRVGDTLPFQILFAGSPLPGVAVLAARRTPEGTVQTWPATTDTAGRAGFVLIGPGDWIVRLVHMVPSTEPDVDWRSWWASLTFVRP